MSLTSLSTTEIAKRVKLGLVTPADEESSDDEEWDDFDSSEEEEEEEGDMRYQFAQNRRSSVNLTQMSENFHDNTNWDNYRSDSGRNLMYSSGDLDQYSTGGSSRNLTGIARETIQESDDEASTVDGESSA